jgi:hypothetical protein
MVMVMAVLIVAAAVAAGICGTGGCLSPTPLLVPQPIVPLPAPHSAGPDVDQAH